ncbi:hypothetical protein ANN_00248 [Periplaneta americana]|uniref:Uncharacterized protein n=1 Tax=Periplaneta americana TaxID=6978 RepID=A0ABQ8TQE5_PERAM|nr:hypothetical protein ANN_00248 [Periplaneta americana]
MSPGSSTESYPAFARIGLRENPGKTSTRFQSLKLKNAFWGGPAVVQAPSGISWGMPDLVRTVGIVGTVGLGGYYLWNRLPERSDASTSPDRIPPPSPPSQSPHAHSRYPTHFTYFYAPPYPPTRPETVTLQSPPSSPPPSSPTPPPPPPPRPILKKGTRQKQGADRPRKRVTIVLPPEVIEIPREGEADTLYAGGNSRKTGPPTTYRQNSSWSSRQRQQEARRSSARESAPQPARPSSTDIVDSQQTPGGSASQPDDASSTGRRDFDLGLTEEEHEALYQRYLASNPTKEQLEFYERAFRKQGMARGRRDGGD